MTAGITRAARCWDPTAVRETVEAVAHGLWKEPRRHLTGSLSPAPSNWRTRYYIAPHPTCIDLGLVLKLVSCRSAGARLVLGDRFRNCPEPTVSSVLRA